MTQFTTINAIPWAELSDEPDIENVAKPLAEHIDTRIVPRFATTTARNTAIPTPTEGMVCHVATHGLMIYSNASMWVPAGSTPTVRASRGAVQNVGNNTPTLISFDSTVYAPWGGHSTSVDPTRVTPPFAGWYNVEVNVGFNYGATNNALILEVLKNGAAFPRNRKQTAVVGNASEFFLTNVRMNGTTDYLEFQVTQLTGGSANTRIGDDNAGIALLYLGPEF